MIGQMSSLLSQVGLKQLLSLWRCRQGYSSIERSTSGLEGSVLFIVQPSPGKPSCSNSIR